MSAEEPLEIRVEGRSIAVVMRTPGHDRELAAGFLLSEGVIASSRDLFDIATCIDATAGNVVDVALRDPDSVDLASLSRHVFTSSSCGICGATSIDAVLKTHRKLRSSARFETGTIFRLPELLTREQETFRKTGGLHGCAAFDAAGNLIAAREDVGRHNALDKLIGSALLTRRSLRECVLLLSGRVSFEMMQKALAAKIPAVVAIGAPSSLAVEFARASGQSLAGFLRSGNLNVYAGEERFIFTEKKNRSRRRAMR